MKNFCPGTRLARFAYGLLAALLFGSAAGPALASTYGVASGTDYNGFVQGGYTAGRTYSEFSSGQTDRGSSLVGSAAYLRFPFALKLDYRQDQYLTSDNTGQGYTFTPGLGGFANAAPVFTARQSTFDGRLELQLLDPHIYLGAAYLNANNNYGYPSLHGIGIGLEKLPEFQPAFGIQFSAFYYTDVHGSYTVNAQGAPNFGGNDVLAYKLLKYDIGLDLPIANSPVYANLGFSGDRYYAKANAPRGQTHAGPYIALGVYF